METPKDKLHKTEIKGRSICEIKTQPFCIATKGKLCTTQEQEECVKRYVEDRTE